MTPATATSPAERPQAATASFTPISTYLRTANPEFAKQMQAIFNGQPLPRAIEKQGMAALPPESRKAVHDVLYTKAINVADALTKLGLARLAHACCHALLLEVLQPAGGDSIHAEVDSLGGDVHFRASEALVNGLDRLGNAHRQPIAPELESLMQELHRHHGTMEWMIINLRLDGKYRASARLMNDAGFMRCKAALNAVLVELAVVQGTATDSEVAFDHLYREALASLERYKGNSQEPPVGPPLRELRRLRPVMEQARKLLGITAVYLSDTCAQRRQRRLPSVPAELEVKLWRDGGLCYEDKKSMRVPEKTAGCVPGCTVQ